MRTSLILAALLPLVLCGDVISITKNNIDDLSKHPIALVKYYAPWCKHCQNLAPDYESAATALKGTVPLFEINCDEERDLCDKANVQGFPTLKVYANGEYTEEYGGERDSQSIVDYMVNLSAPPAEEIVDATQLKEVLSGDRFAVVLQFVKSDEFEEYQTVARRLRKFVKFSYTKDKLLDSSANTVLQINRPKSLETKLEPNSINYSGKMLATDIEKWIRENLLGLVGIREKKMEEFFHKPLLVAYTQVNFERNPSSIRYHRNRLIEVAANTSTNLQFALADSTAYESELYDIGLTPQKNTTVVVIHSSDGKKYWMEEKFAVPQLIKFVSDYEAGLLEPFIKSEPVPEKQEDEVVKVVGKTFEEIVFDETKDVLIEFFAPWCGHCQALKPKYLELAKKLAKEKDIVVAAIDATANSYPAEFSIQGYPTIFWVPKNSKHKPQSYGGPREVDDMLKFVAKSSTNELSFYTRGGIPKSQEL